MHTHIMFCPVGIPDRWVSLKTSTEPPTAGKLKSYVLAFARMKNKCRMLY